LKVPTSTCNAGEPRNEYAVNGFFIERIKDNDDIHFGLYQNIVFNKYKNKNLNTDFNIFGTNFKILDKLVHVVSQRKNDKLHVYSEW
jgi:RNAse (barnase) inhibitor barstar